MEFGVFLSAAVGPPPWGGAEATRFQEDLRLATLAEDVGFDYFWAPEHHFLESYSHCSASHLFCLAVGMRTTRIRLCTGIVNICPPVNHPLRVAEQIAMIDILTQGRIELGTGRGSGSLEVNGFGVDTSDSRDMWEEAIRAIPRMWMDELFSWEGRYFSVPERNVLPKPVQEPHPPLWVTATSPSTVAIGARLGLGVAVFSSGNPDDLVPLVETYKREIGRARPVGGFVHNKIAALTRLLCLEDGEEARRVYAGNAALARPYFQTYLDSIPGNATRHADVPRPISQSTVRRWVAEAQAVVSTPTGPSVPSAEEMHEQGICVGTPAEIIETIKRYRSAGFDQLVFSTHSGYRESYDLAARSLELMGEAVLPVVGDAPASGAARG